PARRATGTRTSRADESLPARAVRVVARCPPHPPRPTSVGAFWLADGGSQPGTRAGRSVGGRTGGVSAGAAGLCPARSGRTACYATSATPPLKPRAAVCGTGWRDVVPHRAGGADGQNALARAEGGSGLRGHAGESRARGSRGGSARPAFGARTHHALGG